MPTGGRRQEAVAYCTISMLRQKRSFAETLLQVHANRYLGQHTEDVAHGGLGVACQDSDTATFLWRPATEQGMQHHEG
eukprot:scaffold32639_cov112-Isochrysis_galbana.AAC.12